MTSSRLKSFLTLWTVPLEHALRDHLRPFEESELREVIARSVFPGGRRLAPLLLLAGGRSVGARLDALLPAAAAFEYFDTAAHTSVEAAVASALIARAEELLGAQAGLLRQPHHCAHPSDRSQRTWFLLGAARGGQLLSHARADQSDALSSLLAAATQESLESAGHRSLLDEQKKLLKDPEIILELLELLEDV